MAGGRRAQGDRTKATIVDAAVELYATRGFRGTGLIAIGQRAEVAHATVLYHFGSSEQLLLAVLADRDRRFQEATAAAWAPGGLTAIANLPEVARFNAAEPVEARLFAVLQAESTDPDHEAHAFFVQRRRAVRELLVDLVRQAARARELRSGVRPERIADRILAFTTGAQLQWALDPGEVDLVAQYEAFTADLLHEIATSPEGGPGDGRR